MRAADAARGRRAIICVLTLTVLCMARFAHAEGGALALPAPVQDFQAAFDAGDISDLSGVVAADATCSFGAPEYAVPFAGTYRGPAGCADLLAALRATIDAWRFQPRDAWLRADEVLVRGTESGTVRRTGGRYAVEAIQVFRLTGGQVSGFESTRDSAALIEAFEPADAARGRALFTTCAPCHGGQGRGDDALGAPNLTGLDGAYLLRQLRNFRDGKRGGPADSHGFMMIGRANALPGDRGVRDVVAYLEELPRYTPPRQASARGKVDSQVYASCAACHGASDSPGPDPDAPALANLDDGYLLRQLRHFADGTRGSHPDDAPGQRMRTALQAMTGRDWMAAAVAAIDSTRPATTGTAPSPR